MSHTFIAEYPGVTPKEAYQDALAGLETVPFLIGWHDIKVQRFFESVMYQNAVKSHDDDQMEQFRESNWVWVATLKAGD
ncbi:MAG: hypothetical protein M0R66_02160 [Candidatus Omnitrophica bacterium]|nr:hypothetical protein [Candidatus Omnitrophota bacterium]